MFGQEGGCNKTFFWFYQLPVYAKCEKLSFFGGGCFWGNFLLMFKKHHKIGISAHEKQKMAKNDHF